MRRTPAGVPQPQVEEKDRTQAVELLESPPLLLKSMTVGWLLPLMTGMHIMWVAGAGTGTERAELAQPQDEKAVDFFTTTAYELPVLKKCRNPDDATRCGDDS